MSVTKELLESVPEDLRHPGLGHPFVVEMADGTLDPARFCRYLVQNHHFLVGYSRFLAIAASKAPDRGSMTFFTGLTHSIMTAGLERHERLLVEHGGESADLERAPELLTTAYVDFILATAATGGLGEILAVLQPAESGLAAVGRWLEDHADLSEANPYAEWAANYTGPRLQELAAHVESLTEDTCSGLSGSARERVFATHRRACEFDRAFWDMAYGR